MSLNTQFGAELKIGGQETATATETKVAALRKAVLDLATAFDAGEIGQQEFSATLKALNADLRANETAFRLLATAQREQAQEATASAAAAAESVEHAAAEYRALADAKAGAAASKLAEESEREALAIAHETEMLEHEERQLRATKAAEDAEIASVERSVQADLAASNATEALTADRAQAAVMLAKETDFERLDISLKHQEAQAAIELAHTSEMQAMAIQHELSMRTTWTGAYASSVVHAGASTRNWGLAALEASRGLEDMQYGVSGVLNNIPTFTMMLGGPAGLTAAISILAVGTVVAARHWDELKDAFGSSPIPNLTSELKRLEDQIKRISPIELKTTVDVHQLDEAQRKLDALKKGTAEYDRGKTKQSKAEAESGKNVQELLAESDLGLPEIEAQLAHQQAQKNFENSGARKKAVKDQSEARAKIERGKRTLSFRTQAEGEAELANAIKAENQARGTAEESAQSQVGTMIAEARDANGGVQANQRGNLAAGLRGIGQVGLANQIAQQTPEAARQKKAAQEAEANDKAAKEATDKTAREAKTAADKAATAANKAFTDALRDELDVIEASGDLEAEAKRLREAAVARGVKDKALFESVRAGTETFLRSRLQGILATAPGGLPGGNGPLEDAAIAAAKDARLDQAREQGAAARKQATADKREAGKDARGQDKVQEAEFQAEAGRVFATFQADAARVQANFGKLALAEFQHALQQHPFMDPQQVANEVARNQAAFFRRQGATAGGANVAAQQIARHAGFEVALADLAPPEAAPRRPARKKRKPVADVGGPGMRSISPDDGLPRARPAKKLPLFARPKATPAFILAARAKQDRAKLIREGQGVQKVAAASAADAKRRTANQGKFVAGVDKQSDVESDRRGLGMERIANARQADAARRQAAEAAQLKAVGATQDAVANTQAGVAESLAIIGALNARSRQLIADSRALRNRATESGPSASNSGSSVQ